MAKKNDKNQNAPLENKGTVKKLLGFVQNSIDGLYKNTYYTKSDNSKELKDIQSNIDANIDSIINNNIDRVGIPNISKLYSRIHSKDSTANTEGGKKIVGEIEDMFNDKALTDSILTNYTQNRSIKEQDEEVDTICKYMTKLEDALDAKKDSVLSADHFSKDFINVTNTSNVDVETAFNDRIDLIKDKYNLVEVFEDMYDKASRYGEQYIYIIPYAKALTRLVNSQNNRDHVSINHESAHLIHEGSIKASFNTNKKQIITEGSTDIDVMDCEEYQEIGDLKVELNMTGVINKFVNEHKTLRRVHEATSVYSNKFTKTLSDDTKFEGLETGEGIIDTAKASKVKMADVKVPGCIVKTIPRENIIPIYIDDLCLGYYYMEYDANDVFNSSSTMSDPLMGLKNGKMNLQQDSEKKDAMVKYLSGKLSSFIDAKFINANQDLRKELYMLLKHNDLFKTATSNQLKVTFIPPEDMVHVYFKKDPITHRGISDLERALLPAKLYTSLYVTNTVGVLTRGHDKRVYYVKQNVDTNISQTLLNTINQIKKSNFGARELSSVKNILNITGRYNDYIIPVGASGDSPIQFEVMPGQNIDIKTELLEMLEEMAISATDIPYEYVQSRQTVDYAVRLTMSNGKFLRKVFKRQGRTKGYYSDIITKIYNTEYDENDTLEVTLPPPSFLNMSNTNQMVLNVNDYVNTLVEMEMADSPNDEMEKAIFSKNLKRHYLGTYLDMSNIMDIKAKSKMEASVKKKQDEET